jgi:hypothetical protein
MASSPCFPSQVNQQQFKQQVSQQDIVDLYNHMKSKYLSQQPVPHYEDIMQGLVNDTGLPREWIAKMLDANKSIRNVTNAQYFANRYRAQILARARVEARHIDNPRVTQAALLVNDAYRKLYTLWHGPVFAWTHAPSLGEMALQPGRNLSTITRGSREFFNMVGRSWKYWASETAYRNGMDQLVSGHPRYREWLGAAGEAIEIGKPPIGILAAKKPSGAMRAWDAMKPSRLALMDGELWDPVTGKIRPQYANLNPAELKEVMANVAARYNHITGTLAPGEKGLPGSDLWFAPALTVSKYKAVIGDTLKAATLATKGKGRWTAADRKFISLTTRTMASLFASHLGAMAINQAYIKYVQPKLGGPTGQEVNFDPSRPGDWLAFKLWGRQIKPRGMIEAVQVVNKLFQALRGVGQSSYQEILGQQAEYKVSPTVGTALELVRGTDLFGRPVPWSKKAFGTGKFGPREYVDPTKPRYTYPEYILQHGPIFWNEAVREFYAGLRGHNIDPTSAQQIIRGIQQHPEALREGLIQGAGAFVGLGITPDYQSKEFKHERELTKERVKQTPAYQAQAAELKGQK